MDLSGPGIDVKLKERKKERKKTSGYHIGHTSDLSANWRKTHCESKYDKNTTISD
jgi:hypothetical protein